MAIDLSAFHFLRPWGLLLPVAGLLTWWGWSSLQRARQLRLTGIAPHLLPYLIVQPTQRQGWRPVHTVTALLVLGGVAVAGPTWQQDRPDFLDDQASLIVALALAPSMDASDIQPSRMDAVQRKMLDLVAQRKGAKTGLLVYTGRAHTVLPSTDDPALMGLFIRALATDLLSDPGTNAAAAIALGQSLLAKAGRGGSIVLMTDGNDAASLPEVERLTRSSDVQVLILAVGAVDGGVLRDVTGAVRVDARGLPVVGRFDADGLKRLAMAAGAPLGSMTVNGDDLEWIARHAQRHFSDVRARDAGAHWKDAGYWLCLPLVLLAGVCLRRGFAVNWLAGVMMIVIMAAAAPAQAGPLADAFATRDQQGRWAFEHGRYGDAAALFVDPYWKGRAAYEAADFEQALDAFAHVETAEGYFYIGNTQARLQAYPAAIAAYDEALRRRVDFPQATFNRQLVRRLQAERDKAREGADPSEKADKLVFDNDKQRGKTGRVTTPGADSAELWLSNLTTSPADFLRRKFLSDEAAPPSAPVPSPVSPSSSTPVPVPFPLSAPASVAAGSPS
ncbi:VWA domain-containing protein [Schauerella aestuarii]|uniref:VWA domain-containing protein n=1 Tax=Schauerella aestuarii TaxID=2511204 RepID=UPI00136B313A|nr:VWA domain-containing protein [Achromobacter aestuarii]MYZ45640.1 VWA domain-containing protein [Achromobacter aestuarii]